MPTEPQGDFALCCGLLIPLYAARATEEVFFGRQGVTLGTAPEVGFLFLLVHPVVMICGCLLRWPEFARCLSGIFARMGGTSNQEGLQCWHRCRGSPCVSDEANEFLTFLPSAYSLSILKQLTRPSSRDTGLGGDVLGVVFSAHIG